MHGQLTNWMQYSARQLASMAVLLSQNGLRSNLSESNFKKFPAGACLQTPLVLHAYAKLDVHVTSLLKILATGLQIHAF